MTRFNRSASVRTSESASAWLSSSSSPARFSSSSALPRIVVIGVLSSCDTSPRNSSLAAFARRSFSALSRDSRYKAALLIASAARFARSSAIVRSASS